MGWTRNNSDTSSELWAIMQRGEQFVKEANGSQVEEDIVEVIAPGVQATHWASISGIQS